MSDAEEEKPFAAEIAKQGRAVCKKCKQKCEKDQLRIAKLVASPFGSGKMKSWHHLDCMFEVFLKQRATTKRIDDPIDDIDGWESLAKDHQDNIMKKIAEIDKHFEEKHGIKPPERKKIPSKPKNKDKAEPSSSLKDDISDDTPKPNVDPNHKENSFREFRRLVADITNISSYLDKTAAVNKLFTDGSDGSGFKGDVVLWCRLLLPGVVKRIYNIQSKQLVKLFSKIFRTNQDAMLEHLEQGDVGETIQAFFEKSKSLKSAKKSKLTLKEVDDFLEELSNLTKEEEQIEHLKSFAAKCTPNDLKIAVRLIKHDLRMNAGAKHILDGVHPDAYGAYQSSRDIKTVITRCLDKKGKHSKGSNNIKATISLMTPVLPMLAEACKSVDQAMKKCPNGMYSEIKYDGERVQVHKKGSEFKYFSRSLKPVLEHKISHFKNYIPQAFPHATDLILDSEILMIDTLTGKPLPFGTLGKHKKTEFQDASVCLFVFDCIYYNGDILTDKPLRHRKDILKSTMTEIPNHIVFSEMEEIHDPKDLSNMIAKVLKLGLEGLVLKDLKSVYEPGKRHWLKVKKDYLFGGAMADSADLIVLGAWYGTGKKGGMMSVFLMGCYDEKSEKFCTVTKVHTGHDDKTLEKLQSELEMVKISGDASKVPGWLKCNKPMIPDFVAKDPKAQPVWEITGAEFTQHEVHTADGISIRFPRVTKIRDDKDWKTATTFDELKVLFTNSKEHTDVSLLMKEYEDKQSECGDNEGSPNKNKNKNGKQNNLLNFVKTDDRPRKRKASPASTSSANDNNKRQKIEIENPLPDYFQQVRLMVDDEVKNDHPDLIRYFVAYGGTILQEDRNGSVTHMVHYKNSVSEKSTECSPEVKHVTVDWLKSCISKKAVQDFKPYAVILKPN